MTKKTKAKKTAKPKTKKKAKRATPDQWIETVCDIAEQIGTSTKILGRGMAPESINLIEAMRVIAEAAQPITGRGVGYKLFVAEADPVDGAQRHAARLSAAADRARGGHHSVGLDR